MTEELMLRISLLEDGNAWPSTIELINDLADRIEQLTAEVERKDAEIARLHLDIEAQECLQDSAYRAGMKFGWNCAVDDDRKSYDAVMSSTEHVAVLKRIREARAALERKQ